MSNICLMLSSYVDTCFVHFSLVLTWTFGAGCRLVFMAGLRGATGAIAPGPPLQWGPRDEIYLFQIKYWFEKFL